MNVNLLTCPGLHWVNLYHTNYCCKKNPLNSRPSGCDTEVISVCLLSAMMQGTNSSLSLQHLMEHFPLTSEVTFFHKSLAEKKVVQFRTKTSFIYFCAKLGSNPDGAVCCWCRTCILPAYHTFQQSSRVCLAMGAGHSDKAMQGEGGIRGRTLQNSNGVGEEKRSGLERGKGQWWQQLPNPHPLPRPNLSLQTHVDLCPPYCWCNPSRTIKLAWAFLSTRKQRFPYVKEVSTCQNFLTRYSRYHMGGAESSGGIGLLET